MKSLAEICTRLTETVPEGSGDHIHLEDYEILTQRSIPLVVSCLTKGGKKYSEARGEHGCP